MLLQPRDALSLTKADRSWLKPPCTVHHRPLWRRGGLLAGCRAEIMAGRGSFIESFPVFGYNLEDYDELFAEKLDLLLAIRDSVKVTWSGNLRAPINDRGVYPRPLQDKLPIWIAIGGTPQSAARAGVPGLPPARG